MASLTEIGSVVRAWVAAVYAWTRSGVSSSPPGSSLMQEMPSSRAGHPVAATRAASPPSSAGVSACTEAMTGSRSSAKDVRTASQCSTGLLEYVVLFSMPEGNRKIRSSRPWGGLGWIVLVTTAPVPPRSVEPCAAPVPRTRLGEATRARLGEATRARLGEIDRLAPRRP